MAHARSPFADAALGVLLLAIVALLVVPVPTPLLDLLIASNIAVGVLMLLMAMALPQGLAFTAMPTVLLVTTLYRLALNVSSTRLILLQADAGRVIQAFGDYVVAGNYAVGAVVFAVLTLIQYVVVARGSERVAEVSARFTLDAMPGKQMAIDADLRASAITVDAARERRRWIEREGQFYGAMDGAMKFVKGDAIAGIAITLINLIAGVAIGTGMRDMSVQDSLQTYGLLTVGDGLVCQIPSLLISTSAGLVVTRVAAKDERTSLGSELGAQLFGNARVLLMSGGFLLFLAVVPGLPALPFALLGLALALPGLWLGRRGESVDGDPALAEATDRRLPAPLAVVIEIGPELASIERGSRVASSSFEIDRARDRVFETLGLPLPGVGVRARAELAARAYRICLWDVPVFGGELPAALGARERGEAIGRALEVVARRHAAELLGLQETQNLLEALERSAPALVHHVVPKPVSLGLLRDVLRCLLAEGVSIRALGPILESLSCDAPAAGDPAALADGVRVRLSRQICAAHASDGVIAAHTLDPMIEDALRDALPARGGAGGLALAPDQARDIVDAVRRAAAAGRGASAVLLTQSDVRRPLRALLEHELPQVSVLSYAELAPDARIERRAPIRIGTTRSAQALAQAE